MKTVLALGCESSGNRLLYRILCTATPALELVLCTGHNSKAAHPITLPHNDAMPDVAKIIADAQPDKIILLRRNAIEQTWRAFENGHTPNIEMAVLERMLADEVMASITGDIFHLDYDWLRMDRSAQMANLERFLGVRLSLTEPIYQRGKAAA